MTIKQEKFFEPQIRRILVNDFNPSKLEIKDMSHQHHGHDGYDERGSHFLIEIESEKFKDLTMVNKHRLIKNSLKECFENGLHSISII